MKKKGNFTTIILILILVIGLSLLLYPTISEWWNERHQARAISLFSEQLAQIDDDQYVEIWENAKAYNEGLNLRENPYVVPDELAYYGQLSISENQPMGYVEIPLIDTKLAIYHGTSDAVLQVAVGHIDWSSLPTGGESTHCVLSGHRGLPAARLFTDLDKLQVGDLFYLWILDEKLTYEVDQILIVEPYDTEALIVEPGKDLCTLVTCTPYSVNTHRMLVRGHRVENEAESVIVRVTADALQIEPLLIAIILFVPTLLLFLLIARFFTPKKRKKTRDAKIPHH